MRHVTVVLVAAGAACAGCIGSEQLDPGDLARWAALHHDPSALAPCECPEVGGRRLPKRWVFRRHPSLVWSAMSIVRASDRLKEGAEDVEVLVSPEHARALADLMARGREALEEMREVCEFDEAVDADRWARAMAKALAGLEGVTRAVATDPSEAVGDADPLGAPAGPMLDLLTQYLNQRAGGALLRDLPPEDLHRLRAVLVQTVLRVGFAAAGRRQPEGLREAVEAEMRRADEPASLRPQLARMLSEAVEASPPAPSGGRLSGSVRAVLSYAPKALQALEMLARQWDRMDRVAFEFRTCQGRPALAATLAVTPEKEVRLEDLVMFQPALVFRGTSRIAVVPESASTGETVVAFEPAAETGGVEMRFEGLAWGLAKLLVLPLADGRLREVRVFVGEPREADRVINVALLIEARDVEGDPRRMLHFQDVRRRRIERGPFRIRTVTERKELVFNYLTPEKRYTFTRVKTPEEP